MTGREKDHVSGTETTGHVWDGIKELDNPLPRWWLWIFYATIAFSIVYWVLMPAWPTLNGYTHGLRNYSERAEVDRQLGALKAMRAKEAEPLAKATLQQIEADPKLQAFAMAQGASIFGDNCATCHGQGGLGGHGYPNLRDDVWLWGGSLDDIYHTIKVGVRSTNPNTRTSAMPAFGRDGILKQAQVADVTEYVWGLSGHKVNGASAGRGQQIYADNCAACHGPTGKGNQTVGAPDLTDQDWLYKAPDQKAAAYDQIWYGRGGVMPTWEGRFDDATLKALAVYIHVSAGGK